MGYLDRQKTILQTLYDTNWEFFDGDKKEALESIEDSLKSLPEYANIVAKEQIMIPIWQATKEGEEYRDLVSNLDSSRRLIHDCAIGGVNCLNRLCGFLDIEPFVEIDTTDRLAVANLAGEYVNELYNNNIGNEIAYNGYTTPAFDNAVNHATQNRQDYDISTIREKIERQINEIEAENKFIKASDMLEINQIMQGENNEQGYQISTS